jgi:hypothetical protein
MPSLAIGTPLAYEKLAENGMVDTSPWSWPSPGVEYELKRVASG